MTAAKMHVKKGDKVLVLSGKDKGKEGKIIMALPKKSKVVVEGINKVKSQRKPPHKPDSEQSSGRHYR